jgi:hypothetical protein
MPTDLIFSDRPTNTEIDLRHFVSLAQEFHQHKVALTVVTAPELGEASDRFEKSIEIARKRAQPDVSNPLAIDFDWPGKPEASN